MAFKMNYNKDSFPYKEGYPKHHDKGLTKTMENKGYPKTIAKDKKPDFLDLDGDKNKNESMENAAKDAASNKKNNKKFIKEEEDNFMRQEDDTREDIEDTAPYGLDE